MTLDRSRLYGDPDLVRPYLTEMSSGEWFVFETIAADGTTAIGIGRGQPNPTYQLVIYAGIDRDAAELAAEGLSLWFRQQGRTISP